MYAGYWERGRTRNGFWGEQLKQGEGFWASFAVPLLSSASNENPMNMGGWTAAVPTQDQRNRHPKPAHDAGHDQSSDQVRQQN